MMLAGTINKRHLTSLSKEVFFYLLIGIVAYIYTNLFGSEFLSIVLFMISFGLIQGILDIYLKNSLREEGQIKVLYFQILVSISILAIIFISYKTQYLFKNIPIILLLIIPFFILKILKMDNLDCTREKNTILYRGFSGIFMKLLPTLTYSVALTADSLFIGSDILIARIGFFIFGLTHLYIMSNKLNILSIIRIWQFILIFFVSSFSLLIPLITIRDGDLISSIYKNSPYILLCSLIFTFSLVIYSYMLNRLRV
jgi:hypothetical protein